ncbi:MAG: Helix-turn-helix domain [Acidimicrobiaceae bacterium]|nr:Helix-turn-helix domain [Acidimicrobiaceae bacterium]
MTDDAQHHPRLLDAEEAAWYLNTSQRWVRNAWATRELAGVKIGRSVRFTVRDLDDYIESRKVAARR